MKRIILLASCLLMMLEAHGQSRKWTLSECIDHALENNINIKQRDLSVQQKEVSLDNAKSSRLPSVSAGASQNLSFGRGLTADNTYSNANTTSTSFNLGADMPIFRGFQIKHNIAMSKLDLESATADLEKAKDDIRVAVAQAYVQILYNSEILDVALAQVAMDSLQLQRIENLCRNGKASQAEVAAQQASLGQSRYSAVQAQGNLEISRLELSQLLELSSPEGFDIVRPGTDGLGQEMLLNPEQIYASALGIKPGIKAEELRLAYAETNIKQAKSAYLPSLSLSGGLGSNFYTASGRDNGNFGDQLSKNFSQYIGLSLSVPIFNRFQTRNSVRSATINLNTQKLQLENARKSLYKEIQQAYYNAVASQAKTASSSEAARSARMSYDLTREKYENGKANITEYNEAKNRWLEAESNQVQARYQCLYQTKLLDFYQGIPLSF